MNIIITLTGGGYHSYDLNEYQIQVEDGGLYVRSKPESAYLVGLLEALYAKGDWKRVEFDRAGVGQPRTIHDVRSGIDD